MLNFTQNLGVKEVPAGTPSLELTAEKRAVCRQRVTLSDGSEAGLFLERGRTLQAGEVLQSEEGTLAVVKAAPEVLCAARAKDPLSFAKACYHLGNRHLPLEILPLEVRFAPDPVISGLCTELGLEQELITAPFTPEGGAYGGHHHHHHDHEHDHDHEHGHEHAHE